MKVYLLICVICFLLYACSSNDVIKCEIISVETSNIKQKLILESDEFILLETNDNSVIGSIDKIICYNNNIYILDREITKSVFIFDHSGRFISKISKVGNGPGEYIMPDDFMIDEDTGEIWILDMDQNKIICYSGSDFKEELKTDSEFCFFSDLGQNVIGINDFCMKKDDCYRVLAFDKKLNLKKKLSPFVRDDFRIMWDLRKPLFKDHTGIYITEAFSNVIHKLDNQLNYKPWLNIEFGTEGIDVDKNDLDRDRFLAYLSKTDKAFLVDDFMKNKNLVFFDFFYDQTLTYCFWGGVKEKKTLLVRSILDVNNIVYSPIHLDQSHMYFKVKALDLVERYPNFREKFGDIQEIDNPILIKVPTLNIADIIDKA
ncbi:MAG: 6-bladed beta-propeller [Marinilabiliaceae bacterium]|nr:6-bladed beta-propeller [Marinilabiliaceae bacterium]